MASMNLDSILVEPVFDSGKVTSKVMLDLTVYLAGPSEQELEYLIDLYGRCCPSDRNVKYTIAELEYWPLLADPALTASGRFAASTGVKRPYLEPVRQRIREGRAFEIQFWDGRPIEDNQGSWSFGCRRIHLRASGLHAFVRMLIPLASDPMILKMAAKGIAENVKIHSGHGGLVFSYDPASEDVAFDAIYSRARRFWGVDIENLTQTLPLMRSAIKAVNWITIIGEKFRSDPAIQTAIESLVASSDLTLESLRCGTVLVAGSTPVSIDRHLGEHKANAYLGIAKALEPLFLHSHPDFPGKRFVENGNTIGWIRRFIEPLGWGSKQ